MWDIMSFYSCFSDLPKRDMEKVESSTEKPG